MFAGDDEKSKVFQYTMKQIESHVEVLFEEDIYEQGVLEAYYQLRTKIKMANNRYFFLAFVVKHHIKIRIQFLFIGFSTLARSIRDIGHSRCSLLGSLVNMVKNQGLLKNMRRFICPQVQALHPLPSNHPLLT